MPPYVAVRKINRQKKLIVARDRNRLFSLTEQGAKKIGHMFFRARETEWNFDPSVEQNIRDLVQEGYNQAQKES